jgi:hybrid polyketide synthase/nonribosomal peptide synthetase ACE1
MHFRVLDIEKDSAAQGLAETSLDMVIASFVMHATSKLEQALKNVRQLLKPGGYLVMAEVTNNDQTRGGFIFGALPGWWLGADDGRVLSPCISPSEWDDVLRKTGFSGIDAITPDNDSFPFPGSVLAAQAVDDRISFLRQPVINSTEYLGTNSPLGDLLVIGGRTMRTSNIVHHISGMLQKQYGRIRNYISVEDVDIAAISSATTILTLAELDHHTFENLSSEKFEFLKISSSMERQFYTSRKVVAQIIPTHTWPSVLAELNFESIQSFNSSSSTSTSVRRPILEP